MKQRNENFSTVQGLRGEDVTECGVLFCQAAPTNREAWWHLGRLRMDLGEFRTAVGPLKHALKGWPTHPANPQAWRALVQAALGAGQKEAASGALSRWLEALSGRPDAAVDLGSGGAAPVSETEAVLRVCRATSQVLHSPQLFWPAFRSLS